MENDLTDLFKQGMSRLCGAVTIITAAKGDKRWGLTATAVCSLSAEPPRLICCLNNNGLTSSLIREGRRFCVNVLGANARDVAETFAGMCDVEEGALFDAGYWTTMDSGVPVLKDALVSFDCQVSFITDTGSHSIVSGDVLGVHQGEKTSPLLYFDRSFTSVQS